jgi:hypothetical protein
VAVLARVIAIAAVVGCAGPMAVWLVGAVHGLVLAHGAATVLLAAAGGFVAVAFVAVFGIMLVDLLRQ